MEVLRQPFPAWRAPACTRPERFSSQRSSDFVYARRSQTHSCQPRVICTQSRARVSCLSGSRSPAQRKPPPESSASKLGEQLLTAAAGGLVTFSVTYLANVYTLPSKLDLNTQRLDQQFKTMDQQFKTMDQQSVKLDKALDQLSMKLDKALSDSVDYRREVAELRGGFQVIPRKVPDIKS